MVESQLAQIPGKTRDPSHPASDTKMHATYDSESSQHQTRTVFISKIPAEGITDDVLFVDFSSYGRVLATKVFLPKIKNHNKPEKAIYVGAFIEFASIEVAMHVINTVKEYRGVETNVNWGHRSLVESIKEQRQRQAQQEQQLDGGAAKMDGQDEDREGGTSTSVQVLDLVLHGTLYEDRVFEEEAACDAVHRDAVDPIGLFIQEQAQRWHHELQAYYAMSTPNPMMPMSHPSTGVPTAHAVPMPHGPHASTLRPLHPHVQMAGPAMFHHHSMQGMATAQVMYHPAGLPITPLPQRFF